MLSKFKEKRALKKKNTHSTTLRDMKIHYQLYFIIALPIIWLIVFKYAPMVGLQIAFRDFNSGGGIFNSTWVGFENFSRFFNDYQFWTIITNTITISLYQLIAGFPLPIILALALNSTLRPRFKKTVQMITYMPHFISVVVLVGMIMQFTNPRVGIINNFIVALGGQPIDFLSEPSMFSSLYVWSGVWQSCGWGTIIYLAALASVDSEHHEAAQIDGASRFQRVIHVDLPSIVPTMVILLIMNFGRIMDIGFEKVFLMQNSLNRSSSEIISTFVYKVGLASSYPDYSYASAIGLFNSLINLALILLVNQISRKLTKTSLW